MRKSWVDIQMVENDTKRNFIRIKTGLIIKTRIDKIDKSAFTIILVWMPLSVRSVKEIAFEEGFLILYNFPRIENSIKAFILAHYTVSSLSFQTWSLNNLWEGNQKSI